MSVPTTIALYVKLNVMGSGRTAHLLHHSHSSGMQISWCKRVKWSYLDMEPWLVTSDSGYPVCKSCLKIAKQRLGITAIDENQNRSKESR